MTHFSIEENNIAERYLAGKLSAEEEAGFEEHFIDCEECLDRLATTKRLRLALRMAVAQDAEYPIALIQRGIFARLARMSKVRQASLLLFAVLVVALPMLVSVAGNLRLHGEVDRLTRESADLRRQHEEQQPVQPGMEEPRQTSAGSWAGEDPPAPDGPRREPRTRPGLARERKGHLPSQVGLPIVAFNVERGSDRDSPSSLKEVSISSSSPWIILSLQFEPDRQADYYRATIFDEQDWSIWKSSKLALNDKDTIEITLNGSLLKTGRYSLHLEACTREGRCESIARYPFRLTSTDKNP